MTHSEIPSIDTAERNRRAWTWRGITDAAGPRHARCTLENFHAETDHQRRVVAALLAYVAEFPSHRADGRGVLLYGPRGTGKSHLAVAAVREIIRRHGATAAWCSGQQLFSTMRDGIGSQRSEAELLAGFTSPDVLILDDPLPSGEGLTPYQQSTLWLLLDHRYRFLRPTIVTCNVAGSEELNTRLTPQIADRVRDGAVALQCVWGSHRKLSAVVREGAE
ncbi:MAG: ATP-binding protein [Planctomycetaceae bacterium]|nr:ATP-binding protein [Planctomycetaceae bacterium]